VEIDKKKKIYDAPKIVIVGAGNVGGHLAKRFEKQGVKVLQVLTRHWEKHETLHHELNAQFITAFAEMSDAADAYILAVNDDAIEEVAAQIKQHLGNQLLAHTSGATPSTILTPYSNRYGILYPLQTFSEVRAQDWEQLPVCVDANMEKDLAFLHDLALRLSPKVYDINDAQRSILHVAAVFVNNFSNYLFQIAEEISRKEKIPFELLKPLIVETAAKVQNHSPTDMQTGPARRGDMATLQKHLQYLDQYPDYQTLYQTMSDLILRKYY
jgi:predicted short-subunit dehydrogenase-like oxidoreductase (DUF2520 family)